MGQSASVWLVVVCAFLAANMPFVSQRFMLVFRIAAGKPLALRFLELVVWYLLVGSLGILLENRLGQVAPQAWEFYAITGALFITLSFPGFVWRYLLKHR